MKTLLIFHMLIFLVWIMYLLCKWGIKCAPENALQCNLMFEKCFLIRQSSNLALKKCQVTLRAFDGLSCELWCSFVISSNAKVFLLTSLNCRIVWPFFRVELGTLSRKIHAYLAYAVCVNRWMILEDFSFIVPWWIDRKIQQTHDIPRWFCRTKYSFRNIVKSS